MNECECESIIMNELVLEHQNICSSCSFYVAIAYNSETHKKHSSSKKKEENIIRWYWLNWGTETQEKHAYEMVPCIPKKRAVDLK